MSGMEQVVSMIKSCIVISKGGLPLKELNSSYKELVGDSIPFKKFNHDSLESFLYSIPEVYISNSTEGKILTIDDPKLAHISDMVARQKTDTKKKKPPRNLAQKNSVSYKIRPKVPASSLKVTNTGVNEIKSMIKCCIVTNKGGLRLSDLNRTYRELVGESIHYKKYNYSSLEELLYNIPEVVVTESRDDPDPVLTLSDPKLAHLSDLVAKHKGKKLTDKTRPRKPVVERRAPPPEEVRPPPQATVKPKQPHQDRHSSRKESVKQPPSVGLAKKEQDQLKKQEWIDTVSMIKACLKVNGGELLMEDLDCYYEDFVGEFIPFQKFDYATLIEFLCDIPEIFISQRRRGYLLTLDEPVKQPQNGGHSSTRTSLPYPSHAYTSNKSLLRNSLGSETDVRDLMFKNGMIRVTIKNDLCTKGSSGETALQPADYPHTRTKSRA